MDEYNDKWIMFCMCVLFSKVSLKEKNLKCCHILTKICIYKVEGYFNPTSFVMLTFTFLDLVKQSRSLKCNIKIN